MKIIGLDPGIARLGFGIIDTSTKQLLISCGCITTPEHQDDPERLVQIEEDLTTLIEQYKPNIAVVEKLFFSNNQKTAIQVAQARGVILATLKKHHVSIEELTPLQIKSRLTGYGAASKEQIQAVVTQQLKLDKPPQPDDAADAVAAALCAADNMSIERYNKIT